MARPSMFVHYGLLTKQMLVTRCRWCRDYLWQSSHPPMGDFLLTFYYLSRTTRLLFFVCFFFNNLHHLGSTSTEWKAEQFKTLWAHLCFFSDRRLIVFQNLRNFRFLLFLLNKRNAVENLLYILILALLLSSEIARSSLRKHKLALLAKREVQEGAAGGVINTMIERVNKVEDLRTDNMLLKRLIYLLIKQEQKNIILLHL